MEISHSQTFGYRAKPKGSAITQVVGKVKGGEYNAFDVSGTILTALMSLYKRLHFAAQAADPPSGLPCTV